MEYNSTNRLAEKQLVERVLQGDHHAFGLIIKGTERLVAQIVGRMISHAEDRKDLIQDVYLKAYKHLSGFRHAAKLSTWIGNIAYNTCFNFLERRRLRVVSNEFFPEEPAGDDGVEALLESRQLAAIIAARMEELSPLYKMLLVLFHQEGMSLLDIGQITSLPEGTIKSYLFRARKQLKESVLAYYKEPPDAVRKKDEL
ncbi:MAG TPA: sigma-70 family RNA polymerase sigma factor [Puia sp.]|nr:sigma-70 family RNA polymerase sigma factor [Puia sp.]